MDRCLSERALLRVHTQEGSAAERQHLRLCADCAEHYEALVEDLHAIGQILEQPAPATATPRALPLRLRWAPLAVAAACVVLALAWLYRPVPVQTASAPSISTFAADLSAALFGDGNPSTSAQLAAADALYLQAALDAGWPCTQDRYVAGECNDPVSAFLIATE